MTVYSDTRQRILRNAGMCNRCHTVIESRHVHDFQACECPADKCFVDGGRDYLRRGWTNTGMPEGQPVFTDLSESYEFKFEAFNGSDGKAYVQIELLEKTPLKVRREVKKDEVARLSDSLHPRYDSTVAAFTVWRARAEEALIKEHKRRVGA